LVTLAENCCVPDPAVTLVIDGEMLIATALVTVTAADPDRVGSAAETAVTVTVAGDGTLAGAV
jgi:hypothetical protein